MADTVWFFFLLFCSFFLSVEKAWCLKDLNYVTSVYMSLLCTGGAYNKNDPRDKHILLCLLMTACDLSDQTKNWHNTKYIAVRSHTFYFFFTFKHLQFYLPHHLFLVLLHSCIHHSETITTLLSKVVLLLLVISITVFSLLIIVIS